MQIAAISKIKVAKSTNKERVGLIVVVPVAFRVVVVILEPVLKEAVVLATFREKMITFFKNEEAKK